MMALVLLLHDARFVPIVVQEVVLPNFGVAQSQIFKGLAPMPPTSFFCGQGCCGQVLQAPASLKFICTSADLSQPKFINHASRTPTFVVHHG